MPKSHKKVEFWNIILRAHVKERVKILKASYAKPLSSYSMSFTKRYASKSLL